MRLLSHRLPPDHDIYWIGDDHEGASLRFSEGIEHVINEVEADPKHRFVIHNGDHIEAIMTDDVRYDEDSATTPIPLKQANESADTWEQIRKNVLVMLDGNHPLKLHRFGNLTEHTCQQAGIPFGTYSCKLAIQNAKGEIQYKIFATHGFGSVSSTADDPIRRKANMELALKRKLMHKAGDCILMGMGHTHKLLVSPPLKTLYMVDDGESIKQKYTHAQMHSEYIHPDHRWYVNTGSFLKLYGDGFSGYAERAGYDPVELGYILVKVRDYEIQSVEKVVL